MKAFEYRKFTGLVAPADVRAFEAQHQVVLPQDYVEFITAHGVGLTGESNEDYQVPFHFSAFYEGYMFGSPVAGVVEVAEFLPLFSMSGRKGMDHDQQWVRNPLGWPEEKLPVGSNILGDYFAVDSAKSSPLYYWDHESCEFFDIAESFQKFVDSLTSIPD